MNEEQTKPNPCVVCGKFPEVHEGCIYLQTTCSSWVVSIEQWNAKNPLHSKGTGKKPVEKGNDAIAKHSAKIQSRAEMGDEICPSLQKKSEGSNAPEETKGAESLEPKEREVEALANRHQATLCCGYKAKTNLPYPVSWNPFNKVVQCHNCGEQFIPISREQALAERCERLESVLELAYDVLYSSYKGDTYKEGCECATCTMITKITQALTPTPPSGESKP